MKEHGDLTKCYNGLSRMGLAHTAYNVFQRAQGLPVDWEAVDKDEWELVAMKAIKVMDTARTETRSLSVRQTAEYFCPQPKNTEENFAWQLVVRHLLNCIQQDGTMPLAELEETILRWAKQQSPQGASA